MNPDSKRSRTVFGGDGVDRLSYLPRNIVDRILELLPVEDAARTSILSKNWRYTWASLPNLLLDKLFCQKLSGKSLYVFSKTIDMILFQHLGDIVKFGLDVSEAHFSPYTDIDRWMLYVTRNGVKELSLSMPIDSTYKLPSYVFNCPTLTQLKVLCGVFKPPNSFVGFRNLINLHLGNVTFVPTSEFYVINAPVLGKLTLNKCVGTQYLNIVASQLVHLFVWFSPYLDLNCFRSCTKLQTLALVDVGVLSRKSGEKSSLERLLSLPELKVLQVGLPFIELLSAEPVAKGLPFILHHVWHLSLRIYFERLDQTSYALQLIKCSPNLRKLDIFLVKGNSTSDDNEAVLKYLNSSTSLDQSLDKLKHVNVYSFQDSKIALLFIKLLFACAPSLVRMTIKQKGIVDSTEERNIITELMRFPRASPKAELFYLHMLS